MNLFISDASQRFYYNVVPWRYSNTWTSGSEVDGPTRPPSQQGPMLWLKKNNSAKNLAKNSAKNLAKNLANYLANYLAASYKILLITLVCRKLWTLTPRGEPLWLSGKVMEWQNKQNQKIPGLLPSPGHPFFKKTLTPRTFSHELRLALHIF
jgi:hypothetical protein